MTSRRPFREFLKNRLGFGQYFLADMGDISLKRVAAGPGWKVVEEVIVLFAMVEVRDVVRRAARELAGAADAGIRLEIPHSLKPSLQALEAVSYNLKQKHKNIKRSIKFCDDDMDLILDFNTDPDNEGSLRRISAAQAKAMKPKLAEASSGRVAEVTDAELEGLVAERTQFLALKMTK